MRPTSQRPFWTARSTSFVPWGSREAMLGGLIKTSKMNANASESGAIQPRYSLRVVSGRTPCWSANLAWYRFREVGKSQCSSDLILFCFWQTDALRYRSWSEEGNSNTKVLQQTPTPVIRCRELLVICRSWFARSYYAECARLRRATIPVAWSYMFLCLGFDAQCGSTRHTGLPTNFWLLFVQNAGWRYWLHLDAARIRICKTAARSEVEQRFSTRDPVSAPEIIIGRGREASKSSHGSFNKDVSESQLVTVQCAEPLGPSTRCHSSGSEVWTFCQPTAVTCLGAKTPASLGKLVTDKLTYSFYDSHFLHLNQISPRDSASSSSATLFLPNSVHSTASELVTLTQYHHGSPIRYVHRIDVATGLDAKARAWSSCR